MIVTINNLQRGLRPKIGLALSGGGLRGISHIGVLKALNDHNIPIDYIAGTSAGAIVATMYACGYSPQQMQAIIQEINIPDLIDLKVTSADLFKHGFKWLMSGKFRFWSVLPTGLIKGEKIENLLAKLWHQRTIRETKIPLAITAVDIISADTVFFTSPLPPNRVIPNARYYHNALLYEAVRASISIPGVFFPKKYRGMTLVDGAVKNNLPTDILNHMGADKIIAIDLGYSGQPNYETNSVGEILMHCIEIMGREVTLIKSEQYANIIIRPQAHDLNQKNLSQANEFIRRGYHATMSKMNEIRDLLL